MSNLKSVELTTVNPLDWSSCLIPDFYPNWVFLRERGTSLLTFTMGIIIYSLRLTSKAIFPFIHSISDYFFLSLD